jgi:PAS domain S-box-containing protein
MNNNFSLIRNYTKTIEFRILAASFILFILNLFLLIATIENVSGRAHVIAVISAFFISFGLIFFIAFNTRVFLGRQLKMLNLSVKRVVDHQFSRKYKLSPIPTENEIGLLSYDVSLMLNKLHQRTTQIMEKRDEIEVAYTNTSQLVEIGKQITSCLEMEQLIRIFFNETQHLFDTSLLAIGLYNNKLKGMDMCGIRAGEDTFYRNFDDMTDLNRWSVECYRFQKDFLCGEYNACSSKYFSNLLFPDENNTRQSFIYVPLTLRDRKIGVLTIQNFKKNAYTPFHLSLLKNLAVYLSIALINSESYKRIEDQKNELEKITIELKRAHDHLEEEVKERTKEVIEQNKELEVQRQAIEQQAQKLIDINKELERLSLVATKTDNAIMIMDAQANVLWINECFTRLYTYTYDEFIKARGGNLLQTSFNPQIKDALQCCLNTKKSVYYEALNVTGQGKKIWTQTTLTPVVNENGCISHLLTIDSDITLLKDAQQKIEQQTLDITNSIRYASHIQSAILPPTATVNDIFTDFFIYYRPRNIVSGDFYWWHRKNNKLVVAVADCTGHGVPGALMSMLGISFLTELIKTEELHSAAQILERLRRRIKTSLKQTGKENETSDGMDIALCIIDIDENTIQFSGAFNSLVILRNGEITELEGDRMPIGIYHIDNKPFTNKIIPILPNDRFYMYTDGIADQFGGPRNRKFSSRKVKEVIKTIGLKPMNEQKDIVHGMLNNWMEPNYEQLDDICLMGFRI